MSKGQLTATSTEDAGEHYVLIVFTSIVFRCQFLGICVEDGVSRTAEREISHAAERENAWGRTPEGEHPGKKLERTPWGRTTWGEHLGENTCGRTLGGEHTVENIWGEIPWREHIWGKRLGENTW